MASRETDHIARHRRESMPEAVRNAGRREEIQQEQRQARGWDIRAHLQALRRV